MSGAAATAVSFYSLKPGRSVIRFALVRPGEAAPLLEGLPVERIVGDLADLEALQRGAEGCDQVFHLAALYSFWGHPWEEFYRSNVEGQSVIPIW